MAFQTSNAIKDERLVDGITAYIMRHGELSITFLAVMFEHLELRKDWMCATCGQSFAWHALEFFENENYHNFAAG